jgi:hypothetical protein
MPDDLYDHDILAWSEHQSSLLRRVARGERVNEIDWPHVVEEIEDVGLSELNAVRSLLNQAIVHLLKIHGWPDSLARVHWQIEFGTFRSDARRRFAPSMRQRIDLPALYDDAQAQFDQVEIDGRPPRSWPAECPFSLDELLTSDRPALEARLAPP